MQSYTIFNRQGSPCWLNPWVCDFCVTRYGGCTGMYAVLYLAMKRVIHCPAPSGLHSFGCLRRSLGQWALQCSVVCCLTERTHVGEYARFSMWAVHVAVLVPFVAGLIWPGLGPSVLGGGLLLNFDMTLFCPDASSFGQ